MRRILYIALSLLILAMSGYPAQADIAQTSGAAPPATTVETGRVTPVEIKMNTTLCYDTIFLGARGSGESAHGNRGLGKRVDYALSEYAKGVTGRRLGVYAVDYLASPVWRLLDSTPEAYFRSIDDGVDNSLTFLASRHSRCPNERYVLSGYSQGAMVMHRLMFQLERRGSSWLKRIDGVIVIADGDRRYNQGGKSFGTSMNTALDVGVSWSFPVVNGLKYPAVARSIPTSIRARFYSICDFDDIVCDYGTLGPAQWVHGIYVHLKHYLPRSVATEKAAFQVAAESNRHPTTPVLEVVRRTLPDAGVDEVYSAKLRAQGGFAPYKWSIVTPLPPGLSLSSDGTVSGTPTTSGSFAFRVRVQDRFNQWLRTNISITVVAGASLSIMPEVVYPWNPACGFDSPYPSTITITGSKFQPGELVTGLGIGMVAYIGDIATADAIGNWTTELGIGENVAGSWEVDAQGNAGTIAYAPLDIGVSYCYQKYFDGTTVNLDWAVAGFYPEATVTFAAAGKASSATVNDLGSANGTTSFTCPADGIFSFEGTVDGEVYWSGERTCANTGRASGRQVDWGKEVRHTPLASRPLPSIISKW